MKLNKKITNSYQHPINISKSGLVAIFISARCQSKEQINSNVDEDLRIEINNSKFREIPPEKNIQLFNIPPAFNGSELKGLKKTVIFLTVLNKGENIITLIPRNSAFIEEIEVQELSDKQVLEFKLENKTEDGNRRPWITFALVDLPLKSITARVTAKWRLRDSDDVKLIVDNEIQKNKFSILHKNWLWAGSIFKKLFQNETQTKTVEANLPKGLHYIEFWADRMPVLHEVSFDFGEYDLRPKAKVVWGHTVLREDTNTSSRIIIEKINEGEEVIILEKALKGERIKNEAGVSLSTNRWHKVQYKNQEGYIYSMALEINGEGKNIIQQSIIKEAKISGIDPEIVLALAECESQFFPYTVSHDEKKPEIAFGVMQLSLDLITDLNDKTKLFYSPIDNVFEIEQNIKGGLKYFDHLYNNKYKNDKDRLRKAIAAYNTGPGNVPVDKPLNLELYENQTQRLVKCVGDHLKNKTFQKLLSAAKKTALVLFLGILFLFVYEGFIAPALDTFFNSNSINVLSITESGDIYYQKQYKFPNVVWDKEKGQIDFFNQAGNLVTRMSSEKLNLDQIFNTTSEFQSKDSIHIGNEILEFPKNIFYFLASTFWSCGAQNCHWAFYQFDANEDNLKIIDGDILGATSLYLSPDSKKIAMTRSVHGGICNSGDYLTVIDLENFKKDKIDEIMDQTNYQVNLIESLLWKNNQNIQVETLQFNCDMKEEKPIKKIQIVRI